MGQIRLNFDLAPRWSMYIRVTLTMMTEWPTTLDQPIPFNLISKIVKFRVKKNLERAKVKPRKK